MSVVLKTHRFTIDQYRRMAEAGILSEEDRVELIKGEIVEMVPIGPLHAGTVDRSARVFSSRLGSRVIVRVQNPIQIPPEDSELQPDLALLRPRPDFYTRSHPSAPDIFLAVEVVDTSAERDRRVKIPLYGRAGIPESWLVDLIAGRVEVYRRPTPDGYRDVHVLYQRGDSLAIEAFPDVAFTVADFLG